jgi:hypothetical protein
MRARFAALPARFMASDFFMWGSLAGFACVVNGFCVFSWHVQKVVDKLALLAYITHIAANKARSSWQAIRSQ